MLKPILTLLALALPSVALADDWAYEGGDVPIAYVDNAKAQFQFACRGGDLTVGFWVRAPHKQVAGASTMSMAITPDPAEGAKVSADAGSRFAQDMPLIHSDGASMIVRGPVARQWASIAQRARTTIQLSYVRTARKGGLDVFDSNRFGAGGSSAAIQKVLDKCG
ncbi:MAG: hypothetical protein ACOVO5_05620 [Devosia sp.]|jgi:hypothetical protein|uniref:hypothetical protein n=1 Tax=Devosia sp. TaxID=1871048 RepID=UPI0037BE7C2A